MFAQPDLLTFPSLAYLPDSPLLLQTAPASYTKNAAFLFTELNIFSKRPQGAENIGHHEYIALRTRLLIMEEAEANRRPEDMTPEEKKAREEAKKRSADQRKQVM